MKTAKILRISVYVCVCVMTYLSVYLRTASYYGPVSWHTDRNPAGDTRRSVMAQCRSQQTFLCKPPDTNHFSFCAMRRLSQLLRFVTYYKSSRRLYKGKGVFQ